MVLAFNLSLRRQEKGISECEAFLIIIVSSKLAGITWTLCLKNKKTLIMRTKCNNIKKCEKALSFASFAVHHKIHLLTSQVKAYFYNSCFVVHWRLCPWNAFNLTDLLPSFKLYTHKQSKNIVGPACSPISVRYFPFPWRVGRRGGHWWDHPTKLEPPHPHPKVCFEEVPWLGRVTDSRGQSPCNWLSCSGPPCLATGALDEAQLFYIPCLSII